MNPEDAAELIREKAAAYGKSKAQRVYLEEFRRSKKAMLMKDSLTMGVEAANAQEREALADPEYSGASSLKCRGEVTITLSPLAIARPSPERSASITGDWLTF